LYPETPTRVHTLRARCSAPPTLAASARTRCWKRARARVSSAAAPRRCPADAARPWAARHPGGGLRLSGCQRPRPGNSRGTGTHGREPLHLLLGGCRRRRTRATAALLLTVRRGLNRQCAFFRCFWRRPPARLAGGARHFFCHYGVVILLEERHATLARQLIPIQCRI
jgi:hypothetical protein